MPGRATDGLRPVVDEAPRALEEGAIEALALGVVVEPPELIAQPPEHGRESRAEIGIGAERAGDGPGLEGRDSHLVLLAKAARVRLLAAQVLRVSEEPLELPEEGSAYPVELPERCLLRTPAASWVVPPHGAHYTAQRGTRWQDGRPPMNATAVSTRVLSSARLRESLFGRFRAEPSTDAYRLIHADADGFPGIHVDAYAGYLVLNVARPEAIEAAPALEEALSALDPLGIIRKLRHEEQGRGKVKDSVSSGKAPPDTLAVKEEGIPFEVELRGGFHTGLFMDLREERRRLRGLAAGRRVLNTFAYTGAFSVAAALGGAEEVTTVDVVAKAIERARRNFRLSGIEPEKHRFARMDTLEYLRMAGRRGWSFGAIVLDPPTFAAFRGGTWSAKTGYADLLRLTIPLLERGGLLWAIANTESLPAERFEGALAKSFAAAKREARTLAVGGLPPDYPTPLGRESARYLKVHVIEAL